LNYIDFLQKETIFKHLERKDIDLIFFDNDSKKYKRGQTIYGEGDKIKGFYCILKGIIKVFKTGFDGKDQIIRLAKPGDIIGFRSTITGELACTTTKVLEDSELFFIPGDVVKKLVKTNGDFAMNLLEMACNELREANNFLTDIAQKTVKERLAEVLIQLKRSFNTDKENVLQISLTREDLANMVGTATESVIRLLSEFKNDGLIELSGRRIKIVDEPMLVKLSNM